MLIKNTIFKIKKQREEKAKTKKDRFLLIIFNKINFKICLYYLIIIDFVIVF